MVAAPITGSASEQSPVSPTPSIPPVRDQALWAQGYYSGDPLPPKTVYLTFDDGPCDFTAEFLAILKDEGVKATFFLNSYDKNHPEKADPNHNSMKPYAEVLKQMVADGHAIGNHSYSHRDFAMATPAQIEFQLNVLERHLREVLGDSTPRVLLIRPPFGSPWLGNWGTNAQKRRVSTVLGRRGMVMMWTTGWDSSDSAEWVNGEWWTSHSPLYKPGGPKYLKKIERQLARIFKRAVGDASGVILMHDVHPTSRDMLRRMIQELKARGYTFATQEDYCRWRWGDQVFDRFVPSLAQQIPSK